MPRGGFHPPYPSEFKVEAVRLVREGGRPISEVAKGLGVTTESVRLWLKQSDLDAGRRSDGLTSDEREELRQLRRRTRLQQGEGDQRYLSGWQSPTDPGDSGIPYENVKISLLVAEPPSVSTLILAVSEPYGLGTSTTISVAVDSLLSTVPGMSPSKAV